LTGHSVLQREMLLDGVGGAVLGAVMTPIRHNAVR
jgi:hypothetical protein